MAAKYENSYMDVMDTIPLEDDDKDGYRELLYHLDRLMFAVVFPTITIDDLISCCNLTLNAGGTS